MAKPTGFAVGFGLVLAGAILDAYSFGIGGTLVRVGAALAVANLVQSLNRSDKNGQSETLLGLPISNTENGAPTVWAIGRRVRVPLQVLWMSRKSRDVTATAKGKSGGTYRHVTADMALRINDRPTSRLVQLIAQDDLLSWQERNVYTVRTSEMTATFGAGQVTLAMNSVGDPDFALTFVVDDYVSLAGFVPVGGTPSLNSGYYVVVSVTGHTSTPSTLVLEARSGQVLTGLNSTAGTSAAPAVVTRIDDAVFSSTFTIVQVAAGVPVYAVGGTLLNNHTTNEVFRVNDLVIYEVGGSIFNGLIGNVLPSGELRIQFFAAVPSSSGSPTQPAVIRLVSSQQNAGGYFPNGFVMSEHFYQGTDEQDEDATIVSHVGAGNAGGFHGIAYQVIEGFDLTSFGGVPPPLLEGLIDVDQSTTWADALRLVATRGGLTDDQVDVDGVLPRPFEGYYLRGPVRGSSALDPLLLAGQIATQDRGGVLAFFDIDNADVVPIQNGVLFTDLAAGIEQPGEKKWDFATLSDRDFPTHIGIRHQDPDYGYGPGYQQFGVRNPSASTAQVIDDIDMSNLVLTPKDARNLAATIVRRAVTNGTSVRLQLPAAYLHLLENDLLTFTDDDDQDHLVRITSVEMGTNFLLLVTAVVERLSFAVGGSPVQGTAGTPPSTAIQPSEVLGLVVDAPPPLDAYGITPGVFALACAYQGSQWSGCTVYASTDGNNWNVVGTIGLEHAIGTLTAVLDAGTPSEALGSSAVTWDTAASATIEFESVGPLPFLSVTEQDVLNGWQWFAVLDSGGHVAEVFAARDVVANTATNYTFSHLLRGLRGTFLGCSADRGAGARVVALGNTFDMTGLFVPLPGLSYPSGVSLKFVPPGRTLASVPAVGLSTTWRNVQPFPLRDVTRTYSAGTLRITVDNWTRRNLPVGQVGPYPLDETIEAYRITLYHQSGNGTAVLRKTITARGTGTPTLRDKWVEFSSAEQTSAGYTPGPSETYWIGVEQLGDYASSSEVVAEL